MTNRPPPTINPGMSVREILTRFPSAEAVFEQHGLLGCGGPNGPREPVGFFARVHRVSPDLLIRELNEHLASQTTAPAPPVKSAPGMVVYPIFLVTSLAIAIVAGFTTGVVALAMASLGWSLPGVNWLLLVQTHGRFQLYGWAGLFVFGVAYHVVPRFVTTPIAHPGLARASYWLAVIGLGLSVAQMIVGGAIGFFHVVFSLGILLLLLAAVSYAIVVWSTVRASAQPISLPISFVLAAALWLILGLVLELVEGALSAPGEPIQPAIEEAGLEAVLEGFFVVTALGVSLRTLPVFAGLAATRERVLPWVFGATQVGLVLLVSGAFLAGDLNDVRTGQIVACIGALILLVAVATYVWAINLFSRAGLPIAEMGTGRGWARAIRLAYLFLLIGLALQAEASVGAALTGAPIPWGTLGAARHAFALGFVTLMIVGMASRVIPVFAGKPLWKAWLVDLAAALIGGSVLLRVPIEVLAPYGSSVTTDALLAATGPLALAGLIIFALNFSVTMARPERKVIETSRTSPAPPTRPLRDDDLLAEALRAPDGLRTLLQLGLTYLADPGHRAVAARSLTIAQAARRADKNPETILANLNQSLGLVDERRLDVDPDQTVADVLSQWPSTLDVFLHHGFAPLADPDTRARLAPTISVRQAAASRGVDLSKLTEDLRTAARGESISHEAKA